MNTWLLKTEPSTYSFEDLRRDGTTRWDGITNPVALRFLREAAAGDRAIVYHTGAEKAAVGLAEVVRAAYPDPKNERLYVIDLKAGAHLSRPVTLQQLKADPEFADSPLTRQGRLSFVRITPAQWKRIEALSRG
jgi:predicted RNA-binding protein with PUA-like domain